MRTVIRGLAASGLVLALAGASPALAAPAKPGAAVAATPEMHLKLISELRASGRPRAALAHLDAYDAKTPRSPRAQVLRADCLVDVGQYDAAQAVYARLLKGPEASAAYAGLGRVAALRGDWKAAAAQFAQAVQRNPVDAPMVSDLGFALLRAGDTAGAVFRLRQAAELAPDNPVIRNNLILAYEADGDEEAARRLLAQVKSADDRKAIAAMRADLKPTRTAAVSAAGR